MTTEMIFSAIILLLGIAFMYQYGKRLMAETKLHDLEEDVESIVKTITEANTKNRIGGHQVKSQKASWLQSEFIKMFIEIRCQNKGTIAISDVERLQSEIHKITGDGEVMRLFNKMLGINS